MLHGAETWTLREVNQNYFERSKIWCWRRMEKINWTGRVKNKEVLHIDREERNILLLTKIRKCKWNGHFVLKCCLLKHVIEGKIEEKMRRRVIRSKQLLYELKGTRRYWKFKVETVDNSLWRYHFGRRYGPFIRQTTRRQWWWWWWWW
jgi:hypothetical protein